jgi:hypothetical protein
MDASSSILIFILIIAPELSPVNATAVLHRVDRIFTTRFDKKPHFAV